MTANKYPPGGIDKSGSSGYNHSRGDNMAETEKTSIQITREFRDWLASKGSKDETFEDILRRLLTYPNHTHPE